MGNRMIAAIAGGVLAALLSAFTAAASEERAWMTDAPEAPEINGVECIGKMELDYAESFSVYYYSDGSKLIDIPSGGAYLIVPDGTEAPDGSEEEYKVLYAPIENVYLAATSAMSLIDAIDCTSHITMTGTDKSGWNIQAPIDALEAGTMMFAGRYSEPNYEVLVGNDCHLAIESTMIAHSPEVQEMLEDIDIPVFIDRSSYENSGLGRTEWIKVYGALFDAEDAAFEKFAEQKKILDEMDTYEDTGKTVAYFSINSEGLCIIRQPDDYIAEMIEDAGGHYIFADADNIETGGATASISMEEFYSRAVDADYLVYNGTITGSMDGKDALLDKSDLFTDFKAFQEGQIWQVNAGLYQSTDRVSQLIRDFHIMLTDGDEGELTFLEKIK